MANWYYSVPLVHQVLATSCKVSMEQVLVNFPPRDSCDGCFSDGREANMEDVGTTDVQDEIAAIEDRCGTVAVQRESRAATPILTAADVTPLMTCGRVTPTSTPIYGRERAQLKEPEGLILVF